MIDKIIENTKEAALSLKRLEKIDIHINKLLFALDIENDVNMLIKYYFKKDILVFEFSYETDAKHGRRLVFDEPVLFENEYTTDWKYITNILLTIRGEIITYNELR